MKIIDRKALLAALIMACGNGVLASGMYLPGDHAPEGAGAAGTVSGAFVDPRRQAGFVVANMWAAMMEKTWDREKQEIADMITATPELKQLQDKLETLKFPAQRVKSLFNGMPQHQKTRIISTLEPLSADQINAIVEHVPKLFTAHMNAAEKVMIIKAFEGVQVPEISARVEAVYKNAGYSHLAGMMHNRVPRIVALAPLSVDKITAIGENVGTLFRRNMTGHDQAKIISSLGRLDASKIAFMVEEIERNAEFLFTDDMTPGDRTLIICVLLDLPEGWLTGGFLGNIKALKAHTEPLSKVSIFRQLELKKYHPDSCLKHGSVIRHFNALKQEFMKKYPLPTITDEGTILKALLFVPNDVLTDAFVRRFNLLTKDMSMQDKATILGALGFIPKNLLAGDFMEDVKPLIEGMNAYDQGLIIKALAALPEDILTKDFLFQIEDNVVGLEDREKIETIQASVDEILRLKAAAGGSAGAGGGGSAGAASAAPAGASGY